MRVIDKWHNVLVKLLIAVLIVFMLLIGLRFGTRYVLVNRMGMNNAFTRAVMWDDRRLAMPGPIFEEISETHDWDERYPFSVPAAQSTRWAHRFAWIDEWQGRIKRAAGRLSSVVELYANDHLMFRQPITEAANRYEQAIGWNLAGYTEYNNVVDLGGGYLTTFNAKFDVGGNVSAVADLRDYLDASGMPLLFVQLPNKVNRQESWFNDVVDYYNENADDLVTGMRDQGIGVLDLREVAESQGLNYRALFFKSDHHWLPQTGLWATREIAQVMNDSYGFSIDTNLYNPDQYRYEKYQDWFLGSLGKKVTLARVRPDDFTVIYPNFPVDLGLQIPTMDLEQRGEFDVIYDHSVLNDRDYYHQNTYGAYLYSAHTTHALVRLENHLMEREKGRVLLIGDSFSSTVAPFLSFGISEVDFLDLRMFTGSLRSFIEQGGYDMVVVAYSSLYQVEYDSHKSMYDFR